MADISVLLPDGSSRSLPQGSSVADLAASIGSRLAKAAVAGTVALPNDEITATINGVVVSTKAPITLGYRQLSTVLPQ